MPNIPAAPNLPLGNVIVQDEQAAPVGAGGGKFFTLRFKGAVPADKGGGVVEIDVNAAGSSTIEVQDDGVSLGDFTALDFIGFTVTDLGSGVVSIEPLNRSAYLTQPDWYIDPITGNDANSGATALLPLATFAELLSRWGVGNILNPTGGILTINILSDLPVGDPIYLPSYLTAAPDILILFQGQRTTLYTGAFTAVTTIDRPNNVPWSATDSALPAANSWTGYLGKRVRVTSGANAGNMAWVAKDLGTKEARFSAPASFSIGGSHAVLGAFAIADPFVVESLTSVYIRGLDLAGDYGTGFPLVAFTDLTWTSPSGLEVPYMAGAAYAFYGCSASVQPQIWNTVSWASIVSSWDQGIFQQAGYSAFEASLIRNGTPQEVLAFCGAVMQLDGDTLLQGIPLVAYNGMLSIGTLGVFDVTATSFQNPTAAGIVIGETYGPGVILNRIIEFSNASIYGAGHTGTGINVGPTGKLVYSTTGPAITPSITGTAGDYVLADAVTARAWDEAGGGYTAPIACTWANLDLAVASGGLGANAHNLTADAHIIGHAF